MSNVNEQFTAVFRLVYATSFNAQTAHWHVTGPNFFGLHQFFSAEYEKWSSLVDTVAEHVLGNGGSLPSTLPALAEGFPAENQAAETGRGFVRLYRKYLGALVHSVETLADVAEKEGSAADKDLAGEIARQAAKSVYLADSTLNARPRG